MRSTIPHRSAFFIPAILTLLLAAVPGAGAVETAPIDESENAFEGDSYSFHHQIGALIDDVFQCFSIHMSGTGSNTVAFDGITEFLDPYVDGNQPFIFEFETPSFRAKTTAPTSTAEIVSQGFTGADLFPEGFEDPESGTPLTDACIEIGIDDTLDNDDPVSVVNATIELEDEDGPLFPAADITSAFSDPWDGRLSLVVPGHAGLNIRRVRLLIETSPVEGIFADGFESGNTASWSTKKP